MNAARLGRAAPAAPRLGPAAAAAACWVVLSSSPSSLVSAADSSSSSTCSSSSLSSSAAAAELPRWRRCCCFCCRLLLSPPAAAGSCRCVSNAFCVELTAKVERDGSHSACSACTQGTTGGADGETSAEREAPGSLQGCYGPGSSWLRLAAPPRATHPHTAATHLLQRCHGGHLALHEHAPLIWRDVDVERPRRQRQGEESQGAKANERAVQGPVWWCGGRERVSGAHTQ
jgi:hypothetical protein